MCFDTDFRERRFYGEITFLSCFRAFVDMRSIVCTPFRNDRVGFPTGCRRQNRAPLAGESAAAKAVYGLRTGIERPVETIRPYVVLVYGTGGSRMVSVNEIDTSRITDERPPYLP